MHQWSKLSRCQSQTGWCLFTLVLYLVSWLWDPHDPAPTLLRFCVEFTLESRTPHCTVENRPHTHWMRYITEGFKVCVACEPPALQNKSGSCQGDGQESDKYEVMTLYMCVLSEQCCPNLHICTCQVPKTAFPPPTFILKSNEKHLQRFMKLPCYPAQT